jgi:hypothetical protein
MGKMSRDKGARFERTIVSYFKEYGYDAIRPAQYRGNTGDAADVEGVPYLHIECKAQEKTHLYDWYDQAVRDSAKKDVIPVVIHKQNNKPVLVTMDFESFMKIYKEFEASMTEAGK